MGTGGAGVEGPAVACSARVSSLAEHVQTRSWEEERAWEGSCGVRDRGGTPPRPYLLEGEQAELDRQVAACLLHSMNDWQKKT